MTPEEFAMGLTRTVAFHQQRIVVLEERVRKGKRRLFLGTIVGILGIAGILCMFAGDIVDDIRLERLASLCWCAAAVVETSISRRLLEELIAAHEELDALVGEAPDEGTIQ